MTASSSSEGRALLGRAAIEVGVMVLGIAPLYIAVNGGAPLDDLVELAVLALAAIAFAAVDATRTRRRWRRTGGLALRDAIRTAVAERRLPPDADPETWTYPLSTRQRTVHGGPWVIASVIVLVVLVFLLAPAHRLQDQIVVTGLALELVVAAVLLAIALRDRLGRREQVLADLLLELDAREAVDDPTAATT